MLLPHPLPPHPCCGLAGGWYLYLAQMWAEAKLITRLRRGLEHIADFECKLLSVVIIVLAQTLLGPPGHYPGIE